MGAGRRRPSSCHQQFELSHILRCHENKCGAWKTKNCDFVFESRERQRGMRLQNAPMKEPGYQSKPRKAEIYLSIDQTAFHYTLHRQAPPRTAAFDYSIAIPTHPPHKDHAIFIVSSISHHDPSEIPLPKASTKLLQPLCRNRI